MKVTLYHSSLCPRCAMAGRYLNAIKAQNPDLQIEKIDILKHPLKTLRAGVRFIPALQIHQHTLSGIYLNHHKINNFIASCGEAEKNGIE